MCCFQESCHNRSFLRRFKDKNWTWGYKLVNYSLDGALQSKIYTMDWKSGWNKSNGFKPFCSSSSIKEGIHVYRRRPNIKKHWISTRLLRVKCYKKDFIGADQSTAVFKKVFLYKEDYDKATKNYFEG